MTRRERRTIELALSILEKSAKTYDPSVQTEAVRLALRVLLPYVDTFTLVSFWRVTDNPNPMQRGHNLRRLLEVIRTVIRSRS